MAASSGVQPGKELVVHAAILSFDITVGEGITHKYPTDTALPIAGDRLAAVAMPEGSHKVSEDHTFLLARDSVSGEQLFGIAYFHNRRDPSVPRGAIMKSIVLLARRPFFAFYLPLVRAALLQHLDAKDDSVLAHLVSRINQLAASRQLGNSYEDTITLFGQGPFAVDMPATLSPDSFGLERGALLLLVQRFRLDTMLIWWALLLHVRLLFVGHPASAVGTCCLAAPLLVAPLHGFTEILSPYVPLSHPEPIESVSAGGRYIAGVTNAIFAQKRQSFDALASLDEGSVSGPLVDVLKVKLQGSERAFIRNVLSGIERDGRGEAWVREQFRAFTDSLLLELIVDEEHGRVSKRANRNLWRLTESAAFRTHASCVPRAWLEAPSRSRGISFRSRNSQVKGRAGGHAGGSTTGQGAALQYYELLVESALPVSERSKLLFNLYSSLTDLRDIDALVDRNAVRVLATDAFMRSDSSQVRKYSFGILATLASAVRGIVAVLSCGLLTIFVEALGDPMPAVGTAAANCLRRSASLFIGAQALVTDDVLLPLTRMLLEPRTEELLQRSLLASTLLQVYRYLPHAPRLPGAEAALAKLLNSLTAAHDLSLVLLELLDTWSAPLSAHSRLKELLGEIPDVETHMRAIAADDIDARSYAVAALLADLTSRRWLAVPMVLAGAVEQLAPSARSANEALAVAALQALAVLADTHSGLERMQQSGLLKWLGHSSSLPAAPAAARRVLEVAAQNSHAAGATEELA